MTTQFGKEDLKHLDFFESDDCDKLFDEYRYCCPVCFRYFNHMLKATCCQNYVCRLCIGQMLLKAKQLKNEMRCAHCMSEKFAMVDVHPDEKVREYTDDTPRLRRGKAKLSFD